MHWRILDYSSSHRRALRELYLTARQQAFSWLDPSEFLLADFDSATEGEELLVAVAADDQPLGFVAWWPPDNFVHSLFVAPGRQGQGIGKALLTAALARMERPATLKCLRQNEPALAFYRAQGWQITGSGESENGPYFLLALH